MFDPEQLQPGVLSLHLTQVVDINHRVICIRVRNHGRIQKGVFSVNGSSGCHVSGQNDGNGRVNDSAIEPIHNSFECFVIQTYRQRVGCRYISFPHLCVPLYDYIPQPRGENGEPENRHAISA